MLTQCGQAEVQSKGRGAPAELTGVRMSQWHAEPLLCMRSRLEAVSVERQRLSWCSHGARNQGAVEG